MTGPIWGNNQGKDKPPGIFQHRLALEAARGVSIGSRSIAGVEWKRLRNKSTAVAALQVAVLPAVLQAGKASEACLR